LVDPYNQKIVEKELVTEYFKAPGFLRVLKVADNDDDLKKKQSQTLMKQDTDVSNAKSEDQALPHFGSNDE